jgi:chromosomal replication initiator protein
MLWAYRWSAPSLDCYRNGTWRDFALGLHYTDGADVVDQITEIPLPGRTVVSYPSGRASADETGVQLPAFIAGPENRLVAATLEQLLRWADLRASAVTTHEAHALPFVLALFGPSGVGKTHVSRGLVRHWQNRRGASSAEYVTAQDFRRLFNEAMSANAVLAFREHFRTQELLAIDELHRLPGDDYLLQELRATLDALEERGAIVVVVTSTQPVTSLPNLSPDLRSRFASGLMLQLSAPGVDARTRIVQHVSSALGRPLSDDVINRLATGLHGTASQLIGAIYELCADLRNAVNQPDRLLAANGDRRPTLPEIISLVARHYGVQQRLLKSNSRKQRLVRARATAIYLARELSDASYEQIGRALGGRDHTTIMHSFRKVQEERQHDFAMQETLEDLRRILLSR